MNKDLKIDFVVPWVDGNDPVWIKEFNKYCPDNKKIIDASEKRYRDFGLLKYWFRGVEKFAPWVNKIHFVTCGQKPSWLNLSSSKLHWVKHEDYIPSEYLPVFSANPIEIMIHKIPDLEEHFVYFNDDFYLTDFIEPRFFFVNGKPCDAAIEGTIFGEMGHILLNNATLINKTFSKHLIIKKNWNKWFNFRYGKNILRTALLFPQHHFSGFGNFHFAMPYTKTLFEQVWKEYPEKLTQTMKNRFRSEQDVNQYIFQDYRFCKGDFIPRNPCWKKRFFALSNDNLFNVVSCIESQKQKELVINDTDNIDFELAKNKLQRAFEHILPEKSSFEV